MRLRPYPFVKAANRLVSAAILLVPSAGYAADLSAAPTLAYDLTFTNSATAATSTDDAEQPAIAAADASAEPASVDPQALECMAKVVHHESRGQPRKGQLAVAQTLINRLHAGGRFGGSICAIANQPGQFFNTRAYHPARDGDWDTAVGIARETLAGSAENAAPGAMFFHAAYRAPSSFFRTRQRVAAIGDQIFYR